VPDPMGACRRVVVTGCGAISAAGNDLESFRNALMAGCCLLQPLRHYTAPEMAPLIGAEVVLDEKDALPAEVDADPERARCEQLALAAASRAILHAGLLGQTAILADAGIILGSTLGLERQIGDLSQRWLAEGSTAIDDSFGLRVDNHRLPALIASRYELGGPVWHNSTACSSGNAATAWAFDTIIHGDADVMLAGGADTFTRTLFNGFGRMGALAKTVCRPFDRLRDGVSFGEGAGILVLEELEHARARGAEPLAEILGFGISNDAHHVTAPDPNGGGNARAILQALSTSQIEAARVGYICAHGTGTPYNDLGEVRAIRAVFGDLAPHIPISSIKSIIGHTNGAASALAAIACVLCLQDQRVPPTANLTELDPEFGLDFVMDGARDVALDVCLNLSAGFGGSNACVLLGRAP
jgi:3-oxoacyl-[acyl-carrier-protein] synthase II